MFRSDVEALRALAVTLVVLYHTGFSTFSGGFAGVDVFLVISGFLITRQLQGELHDTGTISIARFYARRAVRLLPAATLVVAVTVLASWWWLPSVRFRDVAADALATTFYAMNFRLAAQGSDYLTATAEPSPLQHFWTLAVEEQFYLTWPLLLIGVTLLGRRTLTLIVLIAVSFALSVWQTAQSAPWAYFGLHTRAWELAAGALVAVTIVRWSTLPKRLAVAARWLGLAGITGSAMWFNDQTPFPGYAAALPVAATVLVIGAGCSHPNSRVLSVAPVQWIGKASYSWYLWHWPVLVIGPFLFGPASLIQQLALAAVSLLLAALTMALVENPLRWKASLRGNPRRGLAFALTLTASTAAMAVTIPAPASVPGLPTVDTLVLGSGPDAERQLTLAVATGTGITPANLVPALDRAKKDYAAIYADECSSALTDATVRKPCFYGNLTSATTVVLFGDSHAGQWFPALELIASEHGWRLAVVIKSACSAASVLTHLPQLKRQYHECVRWRDNAIGYIRSLEPAMVVMSSVGDGDMLNAGTAQDESWASAWSQTFTRLSSPRTHQVLILDTAWPRTDIPECVAAHLYDVGFCGRPLAEAIPAPARRKLIAESSAVTVIDPLPWMCTQAHCPAIVGNVLVYYDASHLSATYARLLAPVLATHLPMLLTTSSG